MAAFNENDVHKHLLGAGLESLILDCSAFDLPADQNTSTAFGEEGDFVLWRIIKERAFAKLKRLHQSIRCGDLIGSKVQLKLGGEGGAMELDFLGVHEGGLFVLELKVSKSAERNAFSELFAYSNYIAGMFALSGRQDIANVLVANIENQITRQAFLYDLLINDRNIVVYRPKFDTDQVSSLRLEMYLPSDEDFRHFSNELLSHESMACVVISFDDVDGWFDSNEMSGSLNDTTLQNLSALSTYAAQLMEAENLHGFCFIRKPWAEIPRFYRNSLFICAVNPFGAAEPNRSNEIVAQIDPTFHSEFFAAPELSFDGRLIRLAQRAVSDCLTYTHQGECETPRWSALILQMQEVVFTHNFGFRPTGIFREAYGSYVASLYAHNHFREGHKHDIDKLQINEINNWLRAWSFMEGCGFTEHSLGNDDEENEQ
ncbi:hypothetical protein K1X12_04310 [Hyphomonas sp. WL0036]|uniref:hypothetical protein n=1 Tax=Hyphomonas sediminis TaxID=2866160 RepID=UPI001C803AAB|nr:hypothetical protein [Hyphomonas sediminis]MBY9066108.1 hypothetical protein [Hyphomonas sediminis]